ncbi:MAG: hypothetical protein ACTS5F_02135 [Candidatus Hodgkinia cicadicola]
MGRPGKLARAAEKIRWSVRLVKLTKVKGIKSAEDFRLIVRRTFETCLEPTEVGRSGLAVNLFVKPLTEEAGGFRRNMFDWWWSLPTLSWRNGRRSFAR